MFLFLFCMSVILALVAGTFYVGARYGRNTEAQVIAVALRIESYTKQEFVDVIAKVKATAASELDRLKKYL